MAGCRAHVNSEKPHPVVMHFVVGSLNKKWFDKRMVACLLPYFTNLRITLICALCTDAIWLRYMWLRYMHRIDLALRCARASLGL